MQGVLVSEPLKEEDDAALVDAALRSPSGPAFRLLYERHAGEVLAFLRKLLGERALAEDLLQETFLRVHQNLGSFDRRRSLRPWLFRIARNAALNTIRKRGKQGAQSPDDVYTHDPSESDRVVKIVAGAEASRAAAKALATLPEESRALLLQRHGLGLKLAASWGVSERTIRNRLRAAIQDLTQALLLEGGAQ